MSHQATVPDPAVETAQPTYTSNQTDDEETGTASECKCLRMSSLGF